MMQRIGIIELGERSVRGLFEHRISTYAAALAYRALYELFPLVLILMVLVTVGENLAQNNASLLAALPFLALNIFVAALPVLFYLLFHRRAAGDAEGTSLDEHQQLAGEHHSLRQGHLAQQG